MPYIYRVFQIVLLCVGLAQAVYAGNELLPVPQTTPHDCSRLSKLCTEGGGARNFAIDYGAGGAPSGAPTTTSQTRDCWQYTYTYACYAGHTTNSCRTDGADLSKCTLSGTSVTASSGTGVPIGWNVHYVCNLAAAETCALSGPMSFPVDRFTLTVGNTSKCILNEDGSLGSDGRCVPDCPVMLDAALSTETATMAVTCSVVDPKDPDVCLSYTKTLGCNVTVTPGDNTTVDDAGLIAELNGNCSSNPTACTELMSTPVGEAEFYNFGVSHATRLNETHANDPNLRQYIYATKPIPSDSVSTSFEKFYSCARTTTTCAKWDITDTCSTDRALGLDSPSHRLADVNPAEAFAAMGTLSALQGNMNTAKSPPEIFGGLPKKCTKGRSFMQGLGLAGNCCKLNLKSAGNMGMLYSLFSAYSNAMAAYNWAYWQAAAGTIGAAGGTSGAMLAGGVAGIVVFAGMMLLDSLFQSCTLEHAQLAAARRANRALFIGSYCSKETKILFKKMCTEETETYCVFPNIMSKVIWDQGVNQLAGLTSSGLSGATASPPVKFDYYAGGSTGQWLAFPQVNGQTVYAWQWPRYCADTPLYEQALTAGTATPYSCPKNLELPFTTCSSNACGGLPADPITSPAGWTLTQVDPLYTGSTPLSRQSVVSGTCDTATSKCEYVVSSLSLNESKLVTQADIGFPVFDNGVALHAIGQGSTLGSAPKPSAPTNLNGAVHYNAQGGQYASCNDYKTTVVNYYCSGDGTAIRVDGDNSETMCFALQKLFNENLAVPAWASGKDREYGCTQSTTYVHDVAPNHIGAVQIKMWSGQTVASNPQLPATVVAAWSYDEWNTYDSQAVSTQISAADAVMLGQSNIRVYGGCDSRNWSCSYHVVTPITVPAKTRGSAQSPDCSGFTPDQLMAMDFSQMDLSEWINSVLPPTPADGSDEFPANFNKDTMLASVESDTKTFMSTFGTASSATPVTNADNLTPLVVLPKDIMGPDLVSLTVTGNWPRMYANPADNVNPVTRAVVSWGDGSGEQDLVFNPNRGNYTGQHTYGKPGGTVVHPVRVTLYVKNKSTGAVSTKSLTAEIYNAATTQSERNYFRGNNVSPVPEATFDPATVPGGASAVGTVPESFANTISTATTRSDSAE